MVKSWNTADDAKLAKLFRKGPTKGGISSQFTDKDSIKKIAERHFPERLEDLKNFYPLFRRKVKKWELGQALNGSRKAKQEAEKTKKKKAAKKKKDEQDNKEDESSEDEDFEDKEAVEESDEDLSYDESIGAEEDEEEEADEDFFAEEEDQHGDEPQEQEQAEARTTMPPKRKSKTPPRKAATKPAAADVDGATSAMGKMSVAPPENGFGMTFCFPHIKYSHFIENRRLITVEILVPTLPNNYFRPVVSPCGMKLFLSIRVPNFFTALNRQKQAYANDEGFTELTHQNTAYKKCAQKINEEFDDGSDELYIWGEPMKIPLLFKCEDEVLWEVQMYPNNLGELTDELGGQQFHGVLVCRVISVEKPKTRQRGGFRVIGSPAAGDGNMEAEEE